MFEAQVAYYLNNYLGKYVYGLDPQSLKISVFKGDVVLRNLKLKPEALQSLDLPVTVKSGLLGSLTLKVPWASLGRSPVLVELDRLYILAGPKQEEASASSDEDETEDLAAAELALKRQRVRAAEVAWTSDKLQLDKSKPPPSGGRLRAIADTVIGNLQLSITNVHIRFEDDVSNPGQTFAMGLTLEKLTAHTIDEDGKPTFVTSNPMELLRKGCSMQRLAFYFDVGSELWQPEADWAGLAVDVWDGFFQPGITAPPEGQQEAAAYILQPIDGQLTYLRRGLQVRVDESQAVQEAEIEVEAVSVQFSREQYLSLQKLLELFSAFSARQPNSHLRPKVRPRRGRTAAKWWRYAAAASRRKASQSITWQQLSQVVRLRKEYVPAYIRCLHANEMGGDDEIAAMDAELPEQTILVFRRLAHAKVEKEKRRAAAAAAAEYNKAQQSQGWLGWIWGGGGNKPSSESQPDERADLTDAEYRKLDELVSEQEAAVKQGEQSPRSLQLQVRVVMGGGSLELRGEGGIRAVQAAMQGLSLTADKFPETLAATASLAGVALTAPEGVIIRAGARLCDNDASPVADSGDEGQQAMDLEFILKPQDKRADTVINLALARSFVTYSPATLQRILDFFRTEQAVDFSALSAQAAARVEQARQAAQQQLAAALQQTPKLAMRLFLEAPTIAIPAPASEEGKEDLTLVVDLGTFLVETDVKRAAALTPEEASLYECLRLEGRDITSFIVQGAFSFDSLRYSSPADDRSGTLHACEDGGVCIPLLERTGVLAAVQAARFAHPRLPKLRSQLRVPGLRFHFSPARVRRVMQILQAALPASQPEDPQKALARAVWRLQAEKEGDLRVLQWGGIGYSTAKWPRRYAVLHRGQLYITPGRDSVSIKATHNLYLDRKVVKVPLEMVGGTKHVLAICPVDVEVATAAESGRAALLRFSSEAEAASWQSEMARSAEGMKELAGNLSSHPLDWDAETASVTSSASRSDLLKAASGADLAAASQAQAMQIQASLGELALFVAGRPSDMWWPPTEVSGEAPAGEGSTGHLKRAGVVNVDGEEGLLVVRASAGSADAMLGGQHLSASVAIGRFEIEDLLVGEICPSHRYLAASFRNPEAVNQPPAAASNNGDDEDDEEFVDARETLSQRLASFSSLSEAFASATEGDTSEAGQQQLEAAWTLEIEKWQPDAATYANVDTELRMRLNTLFFYCNRPTLGALMGLGGDLSAAVAAAPSPSSGNGASPTEEPADEAAEDDDESETPASDDSSTGGGTLVLRGGMERTVFRLVLEVGQLEAALLYEDAASPPLAQAHIEDVRFNLHVHPATLRLTASLGNLKAQDTGLPPDHPFRSVCDLKQGSTTSLIELEYTTHTAEEAAGNPRVPPGTPFASLTASMHSLEVVFLSRFLFEVLRYISLLLALRPEPLETSQQPSQPALEAPEQKKPPAKQEQAGGVLELSVSMEAPVITLPRDSQSRDAVVVDLGSLHVSNTVVWREPGAILVEEDVVALEGLAARVAVDGAAGENIVREYDEGMQIRIQRVLQDAHNVLPKIAVAVKVPSIKAALTDHEYQLITSIAGENFKEEQRLPESARWLEQYFAEPPKEEDSARLEEIEEEQEPPEAAKPPPEKQAAAQSTQLRLTVDVRKAELELQRGRPGGGREPLARLTLRRLWLAMRMQDAGAMSLSLSLPLLEGADLRSGLPDELRLIIASGETGSGETGASFLVLGYESDPAAASQTIKLRLQRPTVTAETGFLLEVAEFFVPSLLLRRSQPIPFRSGDIRLTATPHCAQQDLWLSPQLRLLADAPGIDEFVYDGAGHRVILPEGIPSTEALPVILVGGGKVLTLRNVVLVYSASLPGCLQLGPGAHLHARPEDGVQLLEGQDPKLPGSDSVEQPAGSSPLPLSRRGSLGSPGLGIASPQRARSLPGKSSLGKSPPRATAAGSRAPEPPASLSVEFAALGVGLRFLELAESQEEAAAAKKGVLTRTLAAYLDASGFMRRRGEEMDLSADFKGVRVETTLGSAGGSPSASRGRQVVGRVLEPANVGVRLHWEGAAGLLEVGVSNVRLNLSPDVVQLALGLQRSVLEPLVQPPPEAPLARCSRFLKVWDSQAASGAAPAAVLDTDVLSGSRGVTFWQPQPPTGYAALGDCITAGPKQPAFQVVAVAINSGVVAYPTSWKVLAKSSGLTLWQPVAPEGYVALGHVATADGEEPAPARAVCLHASLGVECAAGECLSLKASTDLRLWNLDNVGATFLACPAEADGPQGPFLTLRSPLGATPALLDKDAAGPKAPAGVSSQRAPEVARRSYQRYARSRRDLLQASSKLRLQTRAVDFTRVWCDSGLRGASREGISLWRPNPPAGYVALSDCLVRGYNPPKFAVTMQRVPESDAQVPIPLLRPPQDYKLRWRDESIRADQALHIWQPVPHPGYVAVGCVGAVGEVKPKKGLVRCVRADAVRARDAVGRPIVALPPTPKRSGFKAWATDERVGGFLITRGEEAPLRSGLCELRVLDAPADMVADNTRKEGLDVVVRTGHTSLLLRDALRRPVAEITLGAIEASLRRPVPNVLQAYCGVHVAAWTFNPFISAWEPLLESWDLILSLDSNSAAEPLNCVEPGTHISVKSTSEIVHVTLAYAAATSCLTSISEWQDLAAGGAAYRRQLAAADSAAVHTLVHNRLGASAQMQLDFGDDIVTAELPEGRTTAVLQPLPRWPLRSMEAKGSGPSPEAEPQQLLLLEMRSVTGLNGLLGASPKPVQARELYMLAAPKAGSDAAYGLQSRAVKPEADDTIEWRERLVLPLPSGKKKLVLEFQLRDAAANAGQGSCLATGKLEADSSDWQPGQEQHQNVTLQATSEGGNARLAVVLLVDPRRVRGKQGTEPTDSWSAAASTAGQRAVSVSAPGGGWALVPPAGLQYSATAASRQIKQQLTGKPEPKAAAALSAVRLAPGHGIVLESTFQEATKHETLRSLCQVSNATQFPLEACLAGAEDSLPLGVVQPGDVLPLPLGWNAAGKQVLVRPVVDGRQHQWSQGVSERGSLLLGELEEGQTRLVSCDGPDPTAAAQPVVGDGPAAFAAARVWLSVSVEGDVLPAGSEELTDWRLVFSPPLLLHNQLPLPAHVTVSTVRSGGFVVCQEAECPSGHVFHVYAADPREAIAAAFTPDGFQATRAEPMVLSNGASSRRVGGRQRLAGSWQVVPNGRRGTPRDILVSREIASDSWQLEKGKEADAGSTVAAGAVLLARFYTALWLVNATTLPLEAAALPTAPPPRADASLMDAADGMKLRVLETRDSEGRPENTVAASAGSLVLVSFPQSQSLAFGSADRQHYGLRLKVAGSGWTSPLPLDSAAAGGAGEASSKPVLIRARVPELGATHELVARLELAGAGFERTLVMRVEQYCLVSNRTGLPLQLTQWRADDRTDAAAASTSGLRAALKGTADWSACMELPAGCEGLPLTWHQVDARPAVCLRLKRDGTEAGDTKWSQPVEVVLSGDTRKFVPLPVRRIRSDGGTREHLRIVTTLPAEAGPIGKLRGPRAARQIRLFAGPALGQQEEVTAVVLRFSLVPRSPGCLHFVLECIASDPPLLLENRSGAALQFRQAGTKPAFVDLPAYSAAGFAWPSPGGQTSHELEMRGAGGGEGVLVRPDPETRVDDGGLVLRQARSGVEAQRLVLPGGGELQVLLHDVEQEVTAAAGLQSLGENAGVGRGGSELALRIVEGGPPQATARGDAGKSGSGAVYLEVALAALEISLVDHTPEEVLLVTAAGMELDCGASVGPDGSFLSLRAAIAALQIDDQLAASRFPVVLCQAAADADAAGAAQPLLQACVVCRPGGARHQGYYPYMALRLSRPLQLAVTETLVWRIADSLQRLSLGAGAGGGEKAGGEAVSDVPMRISLASLSDVAALVSFRGDTLSRPRWAANMATLSWGLDMANFEAVPVRLQGFEMHDVIMLRSVFIGHVLGLIQGQVLSVALSFLRNFGFFSGTSGVLGALSAGVGSLVSNEEQERQRQQERRDREIDSFQRGVAEGGQSLASGFKRGFTGLLNKPLQGARQAGVGGFITGVGKGLVGTVADPLSGGLDMLSSTLEGIDAASSSLLGRARPQAAQRSRLPRAIGGDRKLLPFKRPPDFSERQARIEELGQSMLRGARARDDGTLGMVSLRRRRSDRTQDAYEEHFVLQDDRVAVLTDRAILCLAAPGFAQLQAAAEKGHQQTAAPDVPPAELRWAVLWQDLLALELARSHRELSYPDRLHVHRRGGGRGEAPPAHELRCFPNTRQAETIRALARKICDKYCTGPSGQAQAWEARRAGLERRSLPAELPRSLPSLEFHRLWAAPRESGGVFVTAWRPIGPPGYRSLGDVLTQGSDPPSNPVPMVRYEESGGEGEIAPPADFHLVWRSAAPDGVAFWEPVPPPGYRAMGAVATPGPKPAERDCVVCVREDRCQPAAVFDSPAWHWEPHAGSGLSLQRTKPYYPHTWRCSLWPVDSEFNTFLALRTRHKPPFGSALTFSP